MKSSMNKYFACCDDIHVLNDDGTRHDVDGHSVHPYDIERSKQVDPFLFIAKQLKDLMREVQCIQQSMDKLPFKRD